MKFTINKFPTKKLFNFLVSCTWPNLRTSLTDLCEFFINIFLKTFITFTWNVWGNLSTEEIWAFLENG